MADVAARNVFDHVGAPGTGPPEQPGVPLIWSSDDLKSFTVQETVKLPH
jgi:hypothetical protein